MAELVSDEGRLGADLVEVAFASDTEEGELIRGLLVDDGIAGLLVPTGTNGLMLKYGQLSRGAQRVVVRPDRAEEARRLLHALMFKNEVGATGEVRYADEPEVTTGRGSRNYGLIGGYARAWVWSIGAMALLFAAFFLLRSI